MPASLQAPDAGRAPFAIVEHRRIPGERDKLAHALELALGMEHQVLETHFDVAADETRCAPARLDVLAPLLAENAEVLPGSEPGLAPGKRSVARVADHMNEVRLRQ